MNRNNNKLKEELREINRDDLDKIIAVSHDPEVLVFGRETVVYDKDALVNIINSKLAKQIENPKQVEEKVNSALDVYYAFRKSKEAENFIANEKWDKWKKNHLVTDIVNENKEIKNSDLSNLNELIHSNKPAIISKVKIESPLTQNKPLGIAGDITLNELWNKGLEVFETPLVQMIKDNVNISLLGSGITSMIMYKTVMNIYMKNTYNKPSVVKYLGGSPSTRASEIAFFMIVGAPMVVGALMGINWATAGKTKVILKIGNNEWEGTSSVNSSSSSLFLFLNKLPPWFKAVLKYIALYFILWFIASVIGYNSNILQELSSNFNVYFVYFLKIWTILNFLVVLFYLVRLYILKMYANNKEIIKPEDYPKFIKNQLIEWKEIATKSTPIELAKFYKHCYFLIFLYISIVLFGLTGVVICSIYLLPPL